MTIRIHRCTELDHSTLGRPVFEPEPGGVPEELQSVRLGEPETRLPDRLLERTTSSSSRWHYEPVGPRARMTRPKGSGTGGGGRASASSGSAGPRPHAIPGYCRRGVGDSQRG